MRTFARRVNKHRIKPPLNVQIDYNNPYTKYMTDCMFFTEGGGRYYKNLIDPKAYGNSIGADSTWENNRNFPGVVTAQNGYVAIGNGRSTNYANNTTPCTFRCLFKFNSLANSNNCLYCKYGDANPSSNRPLEFSMFFNSAGNIPNYSIGTSTARAGFSAQSTNLIVNKVYDLVWSIAGTTMVLYLDGNVLVPNNLMTTNWGNSTTTFTAPGSTNAVMLGNDPTNSNNFGANTYYLFQTWVGRALSQVEIRELYNNPFNVAAPGKGVTALENSLAAAVSYYNRRSGVNYGRIGTRTIFY